VQVESEFRPVFDRYGIGTTIWSPLKYGLLSGKYSAASAPEAGTRFAMDQYKVCRRTHRGLQLEGESDKMMCCYARCAQGVLEIQGCGVSMQCHGLA
jgi:aryl-alcohol dehydrogenase-like predicted oxidoreductase